jgi:hypothetical protein
VIGAFVVMDGTVDQPRGDAASLPVHRGSTGAPRLVTSGSNLTSETLRLIHNERDRRLLLVGRIAVLL